MTAESLILQFLDHTQLILLTVVLVQISLPTAGTSLTGTSAASALSSSGKYGPLRYTAISVQFDEITGLQRSLNPRHILSPDSERAQFSNTVPYFVNVLATEKMMLAFDSDEASLVAVFPLRSSLSHNRTLTNPACGRRRQCFAVSSQTRQFLNIIDRKGVKSTRPLGAGTTAKFWASLRICSASIREPPWVNLHPNGNSSLLLAGTTIAVRTEDLVDVMTRSTRLRHFGSI
ncbi:hypothetical protein BDR06DRAFT_973923 [Suillus hirtellus]|nr:hypothetical protein BDR06DRAFT_973923 [Suillus hirtellus]